MGLFEAYVKIHPDMKLKDSNISTMFVPLGKKKDIRRYLMGADPELDYFDQELFEVEDRDDPMVLSRGWSYIKIELT